MLECERKSRAQVQSASPERKWLVKHALRTLELTLELRSTAKTNQRLWVDAAVHHVKANGSRRAKVFKWTTAQVGAGETVRWVKKLRIKPISTRKTTRGSKQ